MKRRTLLGAVGTGFAVLAGCSGSEEPDPEATAAPEPAATTRASTEPTGTPTEAGVGSNEPARNEQLRLFSFDAPASAQIGDSVTYRFTVENVGEEPQTVEPTASVRSGSSSWTEHDSWEPVELAPRELATFESDPVTSDYLATVELRIDGFGETFAVEFVEKQLTFTNQYLDPLDREVSVEELVIRQNYEYTSDGDRYLVESGEDLQWVFVTVKTANRTIDTIVAPDGEGFSLRADERTFPQVDLADDSGYESNRLPAGSGTSGRIAFKTPDPLRREDFQVTWEASFDEGDVKVVWSPK